MSRLFQVIAEDLATHAGDWTAPGFQALAIHRFGVWCTSLPKNRLRTPPMVLYRVLSTLARNVYGIELPHNARIGRRVVFWHQHGIVVHGNAVIGDDCVIHQGVTLGMRSPMRSWEAPTLGRGVNVGAGAKILGAVSIGDNASIGANAVVIRDVSSEALAVGIPAHNPY